MKILQTFSGLNRTVYMLFLARMINSLGAFVYPFLTLFLTRRLALGEAATGFFLLLFSLAYMPGTLLGGKLADLLGRKRIYQLAQGCSALCLVPCAFLGLSPLIPWLLVLSGFFFGAVPPAMNAMVADVTPAGQRRVAYSLLYLGHNLGFALGPAIAGLLFERHTPWIFLGDAATSLLAVLLVSRAVAESLPDPDLIQESRESGGGEGGLERAEEGGMLSVIRKRPFLLAFLLIFPLLSFVYSQHTFCLPLTLSLRFNEKGAASFGLLMSTNALVVILGTTPLVLLTTRVRPVLSLAAAGGLYALGFGMVGLIHTLPWFILSTVLWSLGEILSATNANVYVAAHSPLTHRGRFNALATLLISSGFALGPVVMGAFIERRSLQAVWPLLAGIAAVGAFLLFILDVTERFLGMRRGDGIAGLRP